MGRAPCCSKVGLHRGPWSPKEDKLLVNYIQSHGEGNWKSLPKKAGLLRCGKSCRLRWMNYLRPDIKRGNITPEEDDLIIRLHSLLGNRWSLIAGRLPGRTDNEIKNYWNCHLSKRLLNQGTDPNTRKKLSQQATNTRKNISDTSKPFSERHKIHLPKPIRVTKSSFPRNQSFELDNHQCNANTQAGGNPSSDYAYAADHGGENMRGFLADDLDIQFECESTVLVSEDDSSSLEKLYEEYLQILNQNEDDEMQLDSFAQSLLI
ncbi:myb-related protein 308-like [Gossypium arboreum]|uniref:Myb-related protein 308-like n=1 Tax=Gossypium arboreum TaxID=29729 RepID=A0ABR0P057_GOSAR|nr:myb-related protein 308-like [Gossypium arboreum]KAK5810761.1 hypothetical protein PVK06_026078 [Gossypium arboreum]